MTENIVSRASAGLSAPWVITEDMLITSMSVTANVNNRVP
jgi:hypothetical protein